MSDFGNQTRTTSVPNIPGPEPLKEDPPAIATEMAVVSPGPPSSPLPAVCEEPASKEPTSSPFHSPTHFLLAAALNVLGLLLSWLLKSPAEPTFLPCAAGLSVNFVCISLVLFIIPMAMSTTWCWLLVGLGGLVLLFGMLLACGAYQAAEHAGTERGYASELAFYLILGFACFPFGLYGLFHPSRRANVGAALGATLAYTSIACTVPWILLPNHILAYAAALTALFAAAGFALGVCLIAKAARDSLHTAAGLTSFFASVLAGPYAWAMAFSACSRTARVGAAWGVLAFAAAALAFVMAAYSVFFGFGLLLLVGLCAAYLAVLAQRRHATQAHTASQ